MQFNLRQMFFWITMIGLVLFLIRPIIVYVEPHSIGTFINFYRHIGYLVGIETPYVEPRSQYGADLVFTVIGLFSSIFLHVTACIFGFNWLRDIYYLYCKDYE